MNKLIYSCLLTVMLFGMTGCADESTPSENTATTDTLHDYSVLRMQVDSIAKTIDAKVAVGLIHLETGDTFSYNGYEHCPMMSTCKFPLALLVLDYVDSGKLSLEQKIHIPRSEMRENTHSPMRDTLQGKESDVSIHELLCYTVTMSDNISTDVLLKQVGGPAAVTEYAKSRGMAGISMLHTEGQLGLNMQRPYENWCAPMDMAKLLARFYNREILSATSTDTLRDVMVRTTGGANRIKGLLPEGTGVAHKTGTSGFENGVNIAVNDIGVIALPGGKHLILTVYITDAKAETAVCEKIIAQIAKAAYDDALEQ
ncbi:MAG: class A beta-lactamase [Taibaiella sp.]|nr:class A beta-lactamase [Taibaiella sp.]